MTEAIDHPNQYFKYSRFVKAKGLTGDSCFGSLDNVDLDYDKSLLNFTIEEINNEIDISDDNTEDLNVISNDNKRKAVDLDSDDANVPEIENNRNKKVKINPADINNLSNGKDKELENRTDTCTVNNCGDSKPSTSSAVSSKSDKIYSDMEIDPDFGMNDGKFYIFLYHLHGNSELECLITTWIQFFFIVNLNKYEAKHLNLKFQC